METAAFEAQVQWRGRVGLCSVLLKFNVHGRMTVSTAQHSLATSELDYELPEGRIATQPAEPRDSARMLVVRRSSTSVEHAIVRDLPRFLNAGDALVFNTTAVVPARLIGNRETTGGKVEGLFLHEVPSSDGMLRWRVMLHAGGKLRDGDRIVLAAEHDAESCTIELQQKVGAEWIVRVPGCANTPQTLQRIGRTPLPPYILKARHGEAIEDSRDRAWYQTVYAQPAEQKSVAAPTAGLHFTPGLLKALNEHGVNQIHITLHVGPGTFKPVTAATLSDHQMHSEEFEVPASAIRALLAMRAQRSKVGAGRVIAVGTTSVRTLESLDWNRLSIETGSGSPASHRGSTELLIAPPYEFQIVDGLLTNFHLPRSTLMALVGALLGLDRLKAIYRTAIEHGYRFYSYGDAMLILP